MKFWPDEKTIQKLSELSKLQTSLISPSQELYHIPCSNDYQILGKLTLSQTNMVERSYRMPRRDQEHLIDSCEPKYFNVTEHA